MTWVIWAVLGSAAWGLSYALSEQLLEEISAAGLALMQGALSILALSALVGWQLAGAGAMDLDVLVRGEAATWLVISAGLTNTIGYILSLRAIRLSNAVLATLVEISYPLFTAASAWLLFGSQQITMSVVIGGGLIILGGLIIANTDPRSGAG